MKYQELIIALPCHSLEDFPLYHTGDSAEGLLANWTALWHPALIAAAGKILQWCRGDSPPEELSERLLVVPALSATDLPTGFLQRAKEQGACVVSRLHVRAEIVKAALAELDGGAGGVSDDLAADFFALGYGYLQVQLLTRQMRYASNLDEVHFRNVIVDAAQAALRGDEAHARERLAARFNLLAEERDRYYPVEAFILDLTLVGPTTIGKSLRSELSANKPGANSALPAPINLLLAGETLDQLATKEPETLALLQAAVAEQRVALVGGHYHEGETPLLSRETLRADLVRGLATYERHLSARPKVYGRWRFGLSSALPGLLNQLGYQGALHVPFDEGRMPEGSQFKVRWEGLDGAAIDTIVRAPQDATKPETFLGLAVKMGESMDRDHVATICLAHWPGQASVWYEDLRRIARYCPALGKLVSLEQYFSQTEAPAHIDRFEVDQYRAPYLKQAVQRGAADPISTVMRYWQSEAAGRAHQSLVTLASLVSGDVTASAADLDSALQHFASVVPTARTPAEQGYLIANPCSFVRRLGVSLPQLAGLPAVGRPIYAAAESGATKYVVVDVPPLGFAWVAPAANASRPAKKEVVLAEGYALRNEYFEALINPTTGALQAIHEYNARGNRLSQQLALRMTADGDSDADEAAYSVMAADSVAVTASTTAYGEITASGRLLDRKGRVLGKFKQRFQVWRGSRVLKIDIDLEPLEALAADPWNSYYCIRWAWNDEAAELARGINETRFVTDAKRFEAPHYVDVTDTKNRTTILTGGLPYHRRQEYRLLDSLLIVRGETERQFTVGIGVELAQPQQDAIGLLTPPTVLFRNSPPPTPATSSWLFHLDAKNVVATHWEPLVAAGRATGFRARLVEIAGRSAQVRLSGFRPIAKARLCDMLGNAQGEAKIDDGKIALELAPGEYVMVEGEW